MMNDYSSEKGGRPKGIKSKKEEDPSKGWNEVFNSTDKLRAEEFVFLSAKTNNKGSINGLSTFWRAHLHLSRERDKAS